MRCITKLASALLVVSASACTSDVSGDGTGPDVGHSTVLASLLSGVQLQALTVDADAVYWTDGQALFRCAKNGCNMQPTTLVSIPFNGTPGASTPFGGTHSLVIGGGYAFWTGGDPQSSRLYSCAITGCPNGPEVLAEISSSGFMVDLQADASGVYWTTGNGPTTAIFSCPGTGCSKSPKTIAQASSNGQLSFALSDGRVYFWNGNNNNGGTGSSLPTGLLSCPESGCTSDVRVHFAISAQPGPGASQQSSVVAVDAKAVYLATPSNTSPGSALTRCVLPTCTQLETLASAPGASSLVSSNGGAIGQHMFQTADTLYSQLTQCSGNCTDLPTIASCAKSGCPQGPATRPADPGFPIATSGPGGNNNGGSGNVTIAVDASGIYWAGAPAYYSSARLLVRSPLN